MSFNLILIQEEKNKSKMIDINVEENKSVLEKIIINSKTVNIQNQFSTIKCYQSLPTITTLETRGVNVIKIHKTIYI